MKAICNIVFATGEPEVIVGANLFALDDIAGRTYKEKFENGKFTTQRYDGFEQLLADWRID